jgi:hypothetical protein
MRKDWTFNWLERFRRAIPPTHAAADLGHPSPILQFMRQLHDPLREIGPSTAGFFLITSPPGFPRAAIIITTCAAHRPLRNPSTAAVAWAV